MSDIVNKSELKKTIPWKLVAIFLLFSGVIIIMGSYYYRYERNRIFAEQEKSLSAIAILKIKQISQWYSDKLANAVVIKDNEPLVSRIKQFFKDENQTGIRKEIKIWLEALNAQYDYNSVALLDTLLRVKIATSNADPLADDSIRKELNNVIRYHKIIMTDLHKTGTSQTIRMDLLVPLLDPISKEQKTIGLIILCIDPDKILFPLVQSWPTPSKSSETLILRREGDRVIYLNELRHRKNTALNLKFPLSKVNLLATKAVNGFEGVTEGVDYRNIPVIGALSKISGLPWYMVAKTDKEEILAPFKRYSVITVLVIILLILINASIFGFWIWEQRVRTFKKQMENEKLIHESKEKLQETNEYLSNLFNYANVPIIVWDTSLIIMQFNPAFEQLSGYGKDEVSGRKIDMLFDKEKRMASLELIKSAVGGERWETIEIEVLRKDGDSRIVLWNSANIHDKDGKTVIATIAQGHDITKRKLAEKALRTSEEQYRNLVEQASDGIFVSDSNGKYIDVNTHGCNMLGYSREEILSMNLTDLIPREDLTKIPVKWDDLRAGKSVVNERKMICKDGSLLPVEISARMFSDGRLQGITRDITERKQAEEALLESEKRFRSLYENVTIGIYRTTIDGRILMANPAMVSMLGFDSFEQLAQRNLEQEGYEPDYPRSKFLETIEKDGKIIGLESAWNQRNGNTLYVRESASAIRDNNGQILYYDGTVEDITKRKLVEEALLENEKRLREAQEMAHLGFWLWDIQTGNVEWSDEVFKIFCLDPATFKPQINSILELSPWPEDNQRDKELISRAIESHSPGTYEQKFLRPDKSIGYYYSTFRGNYDNNGDLISIVGTILDITERKKTEEILKESEDKFKYIFDHSVIGKSITFPTGEIHVNKTFCDMLGYSQKELEKTKWQDLSHPDDIEKTQKALNSVISGEKESARFIKRYLHKNGSVIWTDVGTALRRDKDGKPLYFMTAINNITDRIMAEEKLRDLNEELEQRVTQRTEQLEAANKELEAFSYSVSHDLRAPLRSVHAFTKILLEDYEATLDEEGKRICGIISSSATQMGELIDDLLSFSRIGRGSLNPSLIDMKKMARVLFEGMTSPAERERIKLSIGKLSKGYGDSTLLGQVWINLLSNAIKYSSKNEISEIKIGSSVSGEMITYFIKDNGVGFDIQYAHKLFGVFQRLHSEAEFEGNGVGLAIVRRIILRHGGNVWAESEVGKGATFYFSLPAEREMSNE